MAVEVGNEVPRANAEKGALTVEATGMHGESLGVMVTVPPRKGLPFQYVSREPRDCDGMGIGTGNGASQLG